MNMQAALIPSLRGDALRLYHELLALRQTEESETTARELRAKLTAEIYKAYREDKRHEQD